MMNQFLQDLRQFIPSDRIYTDELRTLDCQGLSEIQVALYLPCCRYLALRTELYRECADRGWQALGEIRDR